MKNEEQKNRLINMENLKLEEIINVASDNNIKCRSDNKQEIINIIRENKKKYIGTAGYIIGKKNWWANTDTKVYFPTKIKKCEWFSHYKKDFKFLEINSTFYGTPTENTWNKWYNQADGDFKYSVKVNKYITHATKLHNIEKNWEHFWKGCKLLKDKLGCLLFQFHYNFKNNDKPSKLDSLTNFQRLENLSKILTNCNIRYIFEFRDPSWFVPSVTELFRTNNWSFCFSHVVNPTGWCGSLSNGFNPPLSSNFFTSDTLYLRFHGSLGQYIGSYSSYNTNCLSSPNINSPKEDFFSSLSTFLSSYTFPNNYFVFNNTDSTYQGLPPSLISLVSDPIPAAIYDSLYLKLLLC